MDGAEKQVGGTEDGLPRLLIVMASTRPGRVGLPVSEWVREQAERHGGFDEQRRLQATEQMDESARGMLDALARWVPALRSLRATAVGAT